MGKLRRNLESTYGFAQAIHKEVVDLRVMISQLQSKLEAMGKQVERATFLTVMSGPDVSVFFPVESNEQLNQFMDRGHQDWESRKTAFYHFLFTVASNIKKGFARGLIKALFSRQYINTVKWPSSG